MRLPPAPVRVALADDSYLMRAALEHVLGGLPEIEVTDVCRQGSELLQAVSSRPVDVVVTDMRMPPSGDEEGLNVARTLRRTHPDVGVIVLSQYADPRLGLGLLDEGAHGRAYLLKERVHDPQQLGAAIRVVRAVGSVIDPEMVQLLMRGPDGPDLAPLTAREREVLAQMAQGRSNAAIADELVLTKRAVEKHVGAIFSKLDLEDEEQVSRRVAAVLVFLAATQPDAGA